MARRRTVPTAPPASRFPIPPERLRRNIVPDWVTPGEVHRSALTDDGALKGEDPRDAVLMRIRITAWSRRRAARQEWLIAQHVPRSERPSVLPFRGMPSSFGGDVDAFLKGAGFSTREREADGSRWRYRIDR